MTAAGVLYGAIFRRAANDRHGGWLFGVSYGFLFWLILSGTLLRWRMSEPIAVGEAAIGIFTAHLIYGLALGILFVAALVAVGIPALRASALQPAETLRQE